jgi:hypothetical protein
MVALCGCLIVVVVVVVVVVTLSVFDVDLAARQCNAFLSQICGECVVGEASIHPPD